LKYESTSLSANERCGNSKGSLPPPLPSKSSKTAVDGEIEASDSACKAGAVILCPGRADVLVDGAGAVVFGEPTLAIKSNVEDSPKYSADEDPSLLLG
jgi:hypothetical protein